MDTVLLSLFERLPKRIGADAESHGNQSFVVATSMAWETRANRYFFF